jgi:streptogramin lyase
MNPLLRLAGAAIVALLATGVVFLALRPTSNVGPSATPSPGASVEPTIELPTARQLAPTAVIDLAGTVNDTIPLTTDGTDVWIGVDGAVIHVDGVTNAKTRLEVPAMRTGNGNIAITPEGLWIEDYAGSRIERLNPTTGTVELQADADTPAFIAFVDNQLWIGTNSATTGAYQVDRQTGALGPRIGATEFFAVGLGNVWTGEWDRVEGEHLNSDLITRIDSATGVSIGTLTVPPGTGCAVGGSFPDNIWASCPTDFNKCPANRTAVRIDPSTNEVVTTAKICGTPAVVIDGMPWFLVHRSEDGDNANSLVSVDPATGQLLAQFDLGKIDPDVTVLTDTAVWMSDEQGDRVVRYDLTGLRT